MSSGYSVRPSANRRRCRCSLPFEAEHRADVFAARQIRIQIYKAWLQETKLHSPASQMTSAFGNVLSASQNAAVVRVFLQIKQLSITPSQSSSRPLQVSAVPGGIHGATASPRLHRYLRREYRASILDIRRPPVGIQV
jgi:hypothetical protein